MFYRKIGYPLVFASFFAAASGCGSNDSTASKSQNVVEAQSFVVAANGLSFQISKNSRLSTAEMDYEGYKTILVNISAAQGEPESEIWVTSFPCEYSSSSKGEFQKVILGEAQKLLTDALANGGFKIGTSADFAIQPVPKTSDNYSIYGYYFDFVRTYHADRAERLVVLGDYLNDSQKCIRIKAGSQKSIMINPTTLLGKTLIDVQSSVHFTHN